jgi:predicted component of type VI protein secretion system
MPWLWLNGLTFELSRDETIVGSGAQSTWKVPTVDLRPRHFVVELRGGRASIRPFSTHDVVAVNGHQVASEPVPLVNGDVIAAGSGYFAFSQGEPQPLEDVTPLMPPVAYLIDEAAKKAYALDHAQTGIGRDPSNLVVLSDVEASRFHAEVRREAGGFALHATGSAGTLLNGHQVSGPRLLETGDEIGVASHTYRFARGPLSAELSTTLEMAVLDPRVARHQTGVYPSPAHHEPQPAKGPLRTVFGIVTVLVLLALVLAFLTR